MFSPLDVPVANVLPEFLLQAAFHLNEMSALNANTPQTSTTYCLIIDGTTADICGFPPYDNYGKRAWWISLGLLLFFSITLATAIGAFHWCDRRKKKMGEKSVVHDV